MPVQISDVAKKAGVSRATVSFVLNSRQTSVKISDETKEKVTEAARALDYRPNVLARRLRSGKSMIITVGMAYGSEVTLFDPFIPEFLAGVSTRATSQGYTVSIVYPEEGQGFTQGYIDLIRSRRTDGILLLNPKREDPRIAGLLEENIPFVCVGRYEGSFNEKVHWVDVDNQASGFNATTHLLSKGHRRIALVTGSLEVRLGYDYSLGYRQALEKAGLPFESQYLVEEEITFDGATRATQKLLALPTPPTAIVVDTALMVLGVLNAVKETRAQVEIIGVGSLIFKLIHPRLSMIDQNTLELGKTASKLLIDLLEGKLAGAQHILLPSRITESGSSS